MKAHIILSKLHGSRAIKERFSLPLFKFLLLPIGVLLTTTIACEKETRQQFNFNFEVIATHSKLPKGWISCGENALDLDSTHRKDGIYSIRLSHDSLGYSCIAYSIPGDFVGRQIKLKGYVKTNNIVGKASIALQIQDESGQMSTIDLGNEGLDGTSNWTRLEINTLVPKKTNAIFLGAYLNGVGQLWVDSFELLLDDTDISRISPSNYANPGRTISFACDFKTLRLDKLTDELLRDISLMGKLWGFLKYYHPAIQNGNYDWDCELLRVLPKVLEARTRSERNNIIYKWIKSIGSVEEAIDRSYSQAAIKADVDLSWINDQTEFSDEIINTLNLIKKCRRKEVGRYVELVPGVGNARFTNEIEYINSEFPNLDIRLLGLYRYWNIVEYFYPYRYLMDDWSSVLTDFIPLFINASNALEYRKAILQLVSRIDDSHATVREDDILETYFGNKQIPIDLNLVENRVLVKEVVHYSLRKFNISPGDIIEKINGHSVHSVMQQKSNYLSGSTEAGKNRDLLRYLLRTSKDTLELTINSGGKLRSLKIATIPLKANVYRSTKTPIRTFGDSVYYLLLQDMTKDRLDKILGAARDYRYVILDLRCHIPEGLVEIVGKHFYKRPTEFAKITYPSVSQPGTFRFSEAIKVGFYNDLAFSGKLIVLINEQTQSRTEYLAMALKSVPESLFIGRNSAGTNGNVSFVNFPGGVETLISGIGIFYPEGQQTQRKGLVPDIEVDLTPAGIKEGRDEVLEKALEACNASFR